MNKYWDAAWAAQQQEQLTKTGVDQLQVWKKCLALDHGMVHTGWVELDRQMS